MARDLSLYLNASTPSSDGDLDASDERLLEIIDLFEKRKLAISANKAEELAAAGVFDIRPLSYVLFVTFYEDGLVALGSIFDVASAIFGPQKAIVGPQRNQASYYSKRLTWLWTTMNDHLAYYRKENGADWNRLRQGLTAENLGDVIERGKNLSALLTDSSQEKTASTLALFLGELRGLLAELEAAARKPAPAPADEEEEENDESSEDEKPSGGEEEDSEEAAPAVTNARRGVKRTVTLEVSPLFLEFMKKLQAFEKLVEQDKLVKAAVVADDLQNIIESFDPRAHFPRLLSRFSELLSEHAESLGEHLESRDSFAWKTMTQFYKVDLEKFVGGEGNGRERHR